MAKYCTGCHSEFHHGDDRAGAPEEVNLNTWDDVLLYADRSWIRVYEDGTMPPQGGPSETELAMFDEWFRCEVFPAAGVVK